MIPIRRRATVWIVSSVALGAIAWNSAELVVGQISVLGIGILIVWGFVFITALALFLAGSLLLLNPCSPNSCGKCGYLFHPSHRGPCPECGFSLAYRPANHRVELTGQTSAGRATREFNVLK